MVIQVPEPSTVILLGLGLLAVVAIGWIRTRRTTKRRTQKLP